MTPERWRRVTEIFQAAKGRDPAERAPLLDAACAGDAELRREVERMLASDDSAGSFIGRPAYEVGAELLSGEAAGALAGRTLGHYRVVRLLGAGGMGEVYLAEDTRLGRRAAVKVLPPRLTEDPSLVARFRQEAHAASALNHPNIVTIYEVGETGGVEFLATEFIEGETLRARLSAGGLALAEAVDIAVQTASALAAAHAAGIVHRDVKPENLMLRPDGYVKVLDFGIAKLTERRGRGVDAEAPTRALVQTGRGMVLGTAHYMSPEQARGLEVDARTDVWSLGVVLYEMTAGRAPFAGETPSDSIASILKTEPPPLTGLRADVPAKLEWVTAKALRKDAGERYQTARELLSDLRDVKAELDASARLERSSAPHKTDAPATTAAGAQTTASSAEYIVTGIRRHKRGALLALALLAAALAAAGFGVYKLARSGETVAAPPPRPAPFESVRIARLTTRGNAGSASISPDGRYVSYVTSEEGLATLWVTQVSSPASAVQVVPPARTSYEGSTFAPDGESIYYFVEDADHPVGALYHVPVLGGTPRRVLTDIDSPITFSPDGRRFAFVRGDEAGDQSLVSVNLDGTGERVHTSRKGGNFFDTEGPAWSPDGTLIAVAARAIEGGSTYGTVVGVPVEGGEERPLTAHRWGGRVARVAWLGDGGGLALVASDDITKGMQVWHVSYPEGSARRITNDLNSYGAFSLGLTRDSSTLVTVQEDTTMRIWVADYGARVSGARQLTSGKYDGGGNLDWTADGRILYGTKAGEQADFWLMNADGTGLRQLTADPHIEDNPAASPDGRFIAFDSDRGGVIQVWRADADGGNPVPLTSGPSMNFNPVFTPDGRWVVYVSARTQDAALWKVPVEGGAPVRLTDYVAMRPFVSPDGRLISCFYLDESAGPAQWRIGLVPIDGGRPVKTFDRPPTVTRWYGLRWTADGRALLYIDWRGTAANLWRQPLDGGPQQQITDFKSEGIVNFSLSRDGRRVALTRAFGTFDVVLIRDAARH